MSLRRIIFPVRSWPLLMIVVIVASMQISSAGGTEIQYFGRKVLLEGDTLEILCQATLFEPIVWQKDGKTLVIGFDGYFWHTWNENNTIKSFLNVSHVKIHHSGSYQCTPVHQESHHVYIVSAQLTVPEEKSVRDKVIVRNTPLELQCIIDEEGYIFTWQKDNKDIKKGTGVDITLKKEDNKETSTLRIAKPGDENAGLYECTAKHNNTEIEMKEQINVFSLPTGNMDKDVIVMEGEKLTLDCQATGQPTPTIYWIIEGNVYNSSTERIKLLPNKNNITNAVLKIEEVKMSDRGEYKCVLKNNATKPDEPVEQKTTVRVKDKLAALWPFLGICAEVFVLCAIIFIYEKKRNKAELDESDTDNSPEQKNTPDHGKDSVRQRK